MGKEIKQLLLLLCQAAFIWLDSVFYILVTIICVSEIEIRRSDKSGSLQ